MKNIIALFSIFVLILFYSCSEDRGLEPSYLGGLAGTPFNYQLPPTAGIFPLEGYDSVLDDPNNPFRGGLLTEPNTYPDGTINEDAGEEKWLAGNLIGSAYDAVRFYAWATVLAKEPSGEAQFYTAGALKTLFDTTGNTIFSNMAIQAYQSVLINFYDEQTDSTGSGDFIYVAAWVLGAAGPLAVLGGDDLGFILVDGTDGGSYVVPPPNYANN